MGQLGAGPLPPLPAKQADFSLMFQLAGEAFEQRALAGAVGAEQGGEAARLQAEIEPVQDEAAAPAEAELATVQQGR